MKNSKTRRAGLPLFALSVCSTFGLSFASIDAFASSATSIDAGADADSRRQSALPDVVVTASRIDRDSDAPSVPAGAVVISGDDIRRSGFSNVAEAIEKLGQVRAFGSTAGDANRVIDLGGYGVTAFSNTAVYLDDIRLSQVDGTPANLHTVPVELIERIEIIPGGQSVAYGEGATGGVVRIVTKRDEKKPFGGSVTAGFGSYSGRELRATLNASAGAFGFFASGAQEESNGYREGTSVQNKNGSIGFNWREGLYRASFLTSTESADSDFPQTLNQAQFKSNPRQRGRDFLFSSKLDNQTYNLNVARQSGSQIFSFDVSRRDRGGEAFGAFLRSRQDSTVLKYGDSVRWFDRSLKLNAGLEQRDSDYKFFSSSQQLNQALFGSISTRIFEELILTVGGRSENVTKNKDGGQQTDLSAQAREFSLEKPLSPGATIQYRYSEDFRIANADEEPFGTTEFLKVQTTRAQQATFTLTNAENTTQQVRLFRSAGQNEIAAEPSGIPGVFPINKNLDPTLRQGVEYRLDWPIKPQWQLKTKVAYISAEFDGGRFAGKSVPFVPERQASLNLIWKPLDAHRLETYLTAFSSSRNGNDFENKDPRIPGYVVADLRYVYKRDKRVVTVAINNLTDRSYFTQSFGSDSVFPENGRNFRVTLRQSF